MILILISTQQKDIASQGGVNTILMVLSGEFINTHTHTTIQFNTYPLKFFFSKAHPKCPEVVEHGLIALCVAIVNNSENGEALLQASLQVCYHTP